MNPTKRGLGKGLDALLANSANANARTRSDQPIVSDHSLLTISLSCLQPSPYQPRQDIAPDSLNELADSIRAQGIIQPIVVRALDNSRYEIIAGERRYQAAKLVGLSAIPCIVRQLDDQDASAVALVENIQRENLNAMEEALALEKLVNDFSLTHHDIAKILGKSRTTITNLLRLNNLASSVQGYLLEGLLDMGHARALLGLENEAQESAAQTIIDRKLTVRQAEALVKARSEPNAQPKTKPVLDSALSSKIDSLQQRLYESFDAKLTLLPSKTGGAKLVITLDQFEKLDAFLTKFETRL